MNIIIVGCGKVGFSLAEQLVREKHNITVMDPDEETLQRASDAMDIMTVSGSGSSAVDLRQAMACLGEITGDQVEERLLDEVFGRFCVGK